jgi:hypothetical protein
MKWFGRIESVLFYAIAFQCILMIILMKTWQDPDLFGFDETIGIHAMIGGIIATSLFTVKFYTAIWKKDIIYRYGKIIGPLGSIAWSISFWTALTDFYYYAYPQYPSGQSVSVIPEEMIWTALIPIACGVIIFLVVLTRHGVKINQNRFAVHKIAFMLHGITFGYERAARELLGNPALQKYVVPKTYEFLSKMMSYMGINMDEISKLNVNDALTKFASKAAEIDMAEKVKIKWENSNTFTIESVNCSTAVVRSAMSQKELENSICPWGIMAATIAGKITEKDIEIEPSEFNEIGAKTRLTIHED